MINVPAIVEVFLCDPEGIRLECLDYVSEIEYCKVANDLSPFRLRLPSKFDRKLVRLDNIIEVWYGFEPGTLQSDYCGFLRRKRFADNNGLEYTELFGYSTIELLDRRRVDNYSGSAQALMTDHADDMVKKVAYYQMGAGAAAARDLTNVGGGFTIQADLHDGVSITKAFSYKNCLAIAKEIAVASAQAGTRVYFDIVPFVSSSVTGKLAFQLRTYTGQRGNDRTWNSSKPIFIGREWGNFQNGEDDFDYSEEINSGLALGQGTGLSRETAGLIDVSRSEMSIWNLREGSKDAGNVAYGDAAALQGDVYTYLWENRPKFKFGGEIVETPNFLYKRDWDFGDRVTAIYGGEQRDAMIDKVLVRINSKGEKSIQARLEIEE